MGGGVGFDAGLAGGASSYESASFSALGAGGLSGNAGYSGGVAVGGGLGGGYQSSSSSYESNSYGGVGGGLAGGFNVVDIAFRNADLNKDGRIDRDEFSRFVQQGL